MSGRGKFPAGIAEVITEVHEGERYMVPYMCAAILIYPFWASMVNHIALYRGEFLKGLPAPPHLQQRFPFTICLWAVSGAPPRGIHEVECQEKTRDSHARPGERAVPEAPLHVS